MVKYKLADRSPKLSQNHPKFFRASFYAIPPKEKKVQVIWRNWGLQPHPNAQANVFGTKTTFTTPTYERPM